MLRVLTLSTLFPNQAQPTLGIFVERQTRALAALSGVEVEVVAPVGRPRWPLSLHPHYARRKKLPRHEQWNGLSVHRPRHLVIPRFGEAETPRLMVKKLLPFLERLRETFNFDVIDAEFFWPDGPAAMELSRALGVPFSIKARGADIHYWGDRSGTAEQVLAAGHAADGLIAVSADLKADMAALGIPEDRIKVHHTGVDQEQFVPVDRAAAKAALGVEGPLVVTAGALIPRKGQRLALAAIEQLPDAKLFIVGGGPDRRALESVVRSRGLGDRVRLLGTRAHEELPALLGAADVLLQPSRSEGLANVWVEALACGTPVVTSAVGGAHEVIDRPAAGRLVPLERSAIAAAVRELIDNPPDPQEVRAAAQRFSWERNAVELHAHLSKVAKLG
jgi:teichuronic acid biosynthesis glycosyltransferase TuaC